MRIRRFFLFAGALWPLALAAESPDPAIPPYVAKKALQWMQHPDPEKRQAAYRTFQLYGDEGGTIYRRTLSQARQLHQRKLANLLEDDRSNPLVDLPGLSQSLASERERIYGLVKTDFKKDPDKIAMLRREMDSLAKLNEKVRKLTRKDLEDFNGSVTTLATALAEVAREIHLIDGESDQAEQVTPEKALKATYEGSLYLDTREQADRLKKELSELEKARSANETCDWADPSQKAFARTLNEARSLFALTPLLLEEKLSEAAVDHSRDMAAMGFFAHESPVPGKKSPADRARRAGFQHRWSGENIFMGSTSPDAAYAAWFASDGHRFIMFAKGPNLVGIGPHGRHWTMMTGTK